LVEVEVLEVLEEQRVPGVGAKLEVLKLRNWCLLRTSATSSPSDYLRNLLLLLNLPSVIRPLARRI